MIKQKILLVNGIIAISVASIFINICAKEVKDSVGSGGGSGVQKNKIVAIVNDDIITKSDLEQKIDFLQKQSATPNTTNTKKLRRQILEMMIDSVLQIQLAKKLDIAVRMEELNNFIEDIAKRNNMNTEQLREALTHDGIDYAVFRESIREQALIHKLHGQILIPEINISETDVAKYLQEHPTVKAPGRGESEYHVEDIIVALPDKPSKTQVEAAKTIASKLAKETEVGEDFKKVATTGTTKNAVVKYSDLGWRRLDALPTIFADALNKKQVGSVIGPIEAANGFHIIRLAGTRGGGGGEAIKLTKDKAQELLFQEKMAARLKVWLKELHARAYIKILAE